MCAIDRPRCTFLQAETEYPQRVNYDHSHIKNRLVAEQNHMCERTQAASLNAYTQLSSSALGEESSQGSRETAVPTQSVRITSEPTIRAILAIVFFTYIGQNMLNVSIAPLSRALGLVEWAIGLAVSLAAVAVALLAQFWGRRMSYWGRRRVLLISLFLAVCAGVIFAVGVWAKASGVIGASFATFLVVTARGPFFGAAVSGIPPAGQSLIAQITPDEPSRVRGMAAYSGATNLSIMVGSFVSASLGSWWLFGPVYATPVLVMIAFVIAVVCVPRTPRVADKVLPPKMSWQDPRVKPWVLSVVGFFFANGVVQIIVGFVVQDRLGLDPTHALGVTGWLLLASAAGAMVTQLLMVPYVVWSPGRLVRVGLSVAVVSFSVLSVASQVWVIGFAAFFMGCASGFVGPGFSAGGSLAVRHDEQGALAGLQHAVGALTWIFAPVSATVLYGFSHMAPFGVAAVFLVASALTAWLHPVLRGSRGAGVA